MAVITSVCGVSKYLCTIGTLFAIILRSCYSSLVRLASGVGFMACPVGRYESEKGQI